MPFVLRRHRDLAFIVLSLGTAVAGGALGAFAFGLLGTMFSGLDSEPIRFNPGTAFFGLCITSMLSGLVPHLAGKSRQPDDELGAIVRAGGKLGIATLAIVVGLLFANDGRPWGFEGFVIGLVSASLGTFFGAFLAGPLGMAFGIAFASPILRTWKAWTENDGRSAEHATLYVAGLFVGVAALSQLAPHERFAMLTRTILGGAAVLMLLLHVALRAVRRRFIASLAAHPQLMCVPRELAEVAEGTACLVPGPRSAVVPRSLGEPYRGRPQALALV